MVYRPLRLAQMRKKQPEMIVERLTMVTLIEPKADTVQQKLTRNSTAFAPLDKLREFYQIGELIKTSGNNFSTQV
jgi:hypothetical protein